jgi:hypothetical protein
MYLTTIKNLVVTIFLMLVAIGCKKHKIVDCSETMNGISGRYKITKIESVSYFTGTAQERTATQTACQGSATYIFRADSSASYIENGSCSGSVNGSWKFSNGNFYTNFNSSSPHLFYITALVSWDCTELVLITYWPAVDSNYRYTLRRF